MKNKQIGSRYPVVDGNSLSAAQQQLLSNELENQLAASLNKHQLEAVLAPSGPLMILAGAGSGKTRVITYRIARLISEGVQPWAILALTFTNKAAQEMKERTQSLLRMHSTNLWISTFHSVCLRLLRKHHEFINYPLIRLTGKFNSYESIICWPWLNWAKASEKFEIHRG